MKHFGMMVALIALLFATACSASPDGIDGVSDGVSGSTDPTSGGELTIFGSDPPTLDPALSGDTSSATFVVEIFSGLLTLNQQLQIVPDLAKSWSVSPDGTVYTFILRDNIKFHNGRAVTAQDFKYSIERAADPQTGSHTADTYLGDIKGVKEKLAGQVTEVSGVRVINDKTIEIELEAPRFYFLAKMTYSTAFVVAKENVESRGNWFDTPVGTGPFKLAEYKKGERIILERNPDYYLDPAHLYRVNFLLAGGNSMTMYENDEVHITGVGLNDIDRIQDPSSPLNAEFVVSPSLDVWYVGFNTTKAPFDDPKVRQAFQHGVDRQKIIDVVLKGLVQRADGVLPPGIPGYNPNVKGLGFDPARAKQLLQESKYAGNLPEITFTIPSSSTTVDPVTEAIVEQWRTNLGIEVKIQQSEWATFLGDIKRNPAQNKENKYQLFELGWSADYPDPQDFIDILFYSKSLDNNGAYSNPQVDQLIEAARVEGDHDKRFQLYQQAEQLIVNDAAWIPLYHGKSYRLVKSSVKGYVRAPMIIPTYRYVSLEQ